MKKTITLSLVVLFTAFFSVNANAQFGLKKLKEKTLDKVAQKIEQKANAIADSVSARKQRKDSINALVKQGPVYDSVKKCYTCPVGYTTDSTNTKCVHISKDSLSKDMKKED